MRLVIKLPSMALTADRFVAFCDAFRGAVNSTGAGRSVAAAVCYASDALLRMRNLATSSLLVLILIFAPSLVIRIPVAGLWFVFSAVLAALQGIYVVYQLVMIFLSLVLLSSLLFLRRVWARIGRLTWGRPEWQRVQSALSKAESWDEYKALALRHGAGAADEWVKDEADMATATLLRRAIADLREASAAAGRNTGARDDGLEQLRFALSALTKRNHLGIENAEWYPPLSPVETKAVIDEYLAEVTRSLFEVADSPDVDGDDKLQFFHQVRRAVGVTALCLSGGGAITMYHGGHILGLIEAGLFDSVKVVSGTSGGSIMAAMMGCKTKEELLRDVLVTTVSTDYKRDGSQERDRFVFFPPLWQQMVYFFRRRVLVDSAAFKRTCDYYWGTTTFQEAFEHTHRVLCISVSAQRTAGGSTSYSGGDDKSQRLLMNHITTPHVTLASAVAASCALPGIQRPQRLEAKNGRGEVVPFEVDGVSWIDGSIQADVPFKRMATLFNVSNFVVAQVNFHVKLVVEDSTSPYSPYGSRGAQNPTCGTVPPRLWATYRRLVHGAELSLRMRATMLSQLGLMPSLYGNNLRKVFSQKYHGDVTISPKFTYRQSIGLSAICNPTKADMANYLSGGKRAVWPHVNRLRHMLALEDALSACWDRVRSNSAQRSSLDKRRVASSVPHNLRSFEHSDHEIEAGDCETAKAKLRRGNAFSQALRQQQFPASSNNTNSSSGGTTAATTTTTTITTTTTPGGVGGPADAAAAATAQDGANNNSKGDHPNSSAASINGQPNEDVDTVARRFRRLEWEYRRLRTQMERLRSENLDYKRRLDNIASMCQQTPD